MIESILNDAVIYTRRELYLGAVNKVYPKKDGLFVRKYHRHSPEMDSLRFWKNLDQALYNGTAIGDFHEKLASLKRYPLVTGSCEDYSATAYLYLTQRCEDIVAEFGRAVNVFSVQAGDHEFLMVNAPNVLNSTQNILPPLNEHTLSNAWVCDPWASIVCSARDYPTQWKAKMEKWSGAGKKILQAGKITDPLDTSISETIAANQLRANIGQDRKSFYELSEFHDRPSEILFRLGNFVDHADWF
jgi:hypothetical protein